MSTISVLPSQIANWLSEQTRLSGIRFITEYPAVKKEIPLMVAPDKKTLKKSVKSMFFMVQTRCEVKTIKY